MLHATWQHTGTKERKLKNHVPSNTAAKCYLSQHSLHVHLLLFLPKTTCKGTIFNSIIWKEIQCYIQSDPISLLASFADMSFTFSCDISAHLLTSLEKNEWGEQATERKKFHLSRLLLIKTTIGSPLDNAKSGIGFETTWCIFRIVPNK